MEQIRANHPEGTTGSAFKMAGDLDGLGAPKTKRCPSCGGEMKPEDTFCSSCGKRPGAEEKTPEKSEKKVETPAAEKPVDVSGFFTSGGSLVGGAGEPVKPHTHTGPEVRTSPKSGTSSGSYRMKTPPAGVHSVKTASSGSAGAYPGKKPAGKSGKKAVLVADIKTKKVKNNSGAGMKELIRDIHMEIQEGTLVALLGTAGAGKSTVMNCLNGMDLQGVQGRVLYRGVDLMRNFEEMKYLIGSVPQKKIFHAAFTPEEEFTQAAMLRLPADTSEAEIKRRVDRTLEMLSMTGVRKNRNSKLSGGEQTRVNVGIELVADRDLLCLDEPDQGLSPNYKHELFEIMRNLAHTYGKTVLSIIHDVSEIDMFDQVVMLAKVDGVGRLAFSGTPAEAREYFGCDIRDAYALLERDPKRFVK